MTLSHLKARIYVMMDKDNEAIKVLKKWKKFDLEETNDDLAFYVLGYSEYEGRQLSICFMGVRDIFLALYEIARIKFQQNEYQIAELILKEFHATFTDSEHLFTDPERQTSEQRLEVCQKDSKELKKC